MKKLLFLLFAPLLTLSVSAQEEETPEIPAERETAKPNFEQLDRNQDGAIDLDESKADKKLAEVFMILAKEGKLEQKQYVEWRASTAKAKQ